MPCGVACGYDHLAKCKSVAIFDPLGVKTVLCAALGAGVNLCRLQSRAEFARAAHQIGMNMGFENVCDADAGVPRRLNVNVAISPRIKDRRHSFIIVADEIRKLRDSFSLNCFENERHWRDLTRSGTEVQPLQFTSLRLRLEADD